jgi:glycine cleavage system H protein
LEKVGIHYLHNIQNYDSLQIRHRRHPMSEVVIVLKVDSKSGRISLPADAAVEHVLTALIPKLRLPARAQDGQHIKYVLYHVKNSRIIPDHETLTDAGVVDNDTCLLVREEDARYSEAAESLFPEPVESPQEPYIDMEEFQDALIDIPPNLKYTNQHVWIDVDIRIGYIGITDFLAQQIFLALEVQLPEEGQSVRAGEVASSLWVTTESMDEADLPVLSPVSGVVSEVNKNLTDRFLRSAELELIQDDPYGDGWLFSIQVSHKAELDRLMDAATYQMLVRSMLGDL